MTADYATRTAWYEAETMLTARQAEAERRQRLFELARERRDQAEAELERATIVACYLRREAGVK